MTEKANPRAHAFGVELTALINKHGLEKEANIPDFMIAQYLMWSLAALNRTVFLRDGWFAPKEEPATTKETADG